MAAKRRRDAGEFSGGFFADIYLRREHFRAFLNDTVIRALLLKSRPGNTSWNGVRYLGRGAMGKVGLFARFDGNDNLLERIVVKEVECEYDTWLMPLHWAPGPGAYPNGIRDYSRGIDHSQSAESYIHNRVAAQNTASIVPFMGRSVVEQRQWRYRIHTEFGPHGNLGDVIRSYRNPRNFPETPLWRETSMPAITIPEPFVWYCFIQLCKAAMVMDRGTDTMACTPGWQGVIHRDIKPDNIFLYDPPVGGEWQLYPSPKLGDFDRAVETNLQDPSTTNPRMFRNVGTPGFCAPELYLWYRELRGNFDKPRLTSATNVWAIGIVIYCLVHRIEQPESIIYTRDTPLELLEPEALPLGPISKPGFSGTLTILMRDCLRFNPDERPSLDDLSARLQSTDAKLDYDRLYYKGMREEAPRAGETWQQASQRHPQGLRMRFRDKYRLGLARANLPRLIRVP